MSLKKDRIFGHGKDDIHFDELKIMSSSKEVNCITVMDKNNSFFKIPLDTILQNYKKQQQQEIKIEQKHTRSTSMEIEY